MQFVLQNELNTNSYVEHFSIHVRTCIAKIRSQGFLSGAPNVNFRKIFARKTIWDLEFSEHLL